MTAATPLLAVLALVAVIGLILLARLAVPLLPAMARAALRGRAHASGSPETLALEQSLALDPRRRLLLVRCGARRVLLMTGGAQDVVVGWLDPSAMPVEQAP